MAQGKKGYTKRYSPSKLGSECFQNYQYDPGAGELILVFQERGTYKYYSVDMTVVKDMEWSGSFGQYFNFYIRGRYAYARIG
jgi:hypothetical protein